MKFYKGNRFIIPVDTRLMPGKMAEWQETPIEKKGNFYDAGFDIGGQWFRGCSG